MSSFRLSHATRFASFIFLIGVVAYLIGLQSIHGASAHVLLGISLMFLCVALSIRKPVTILYAIVVYLPFMGLIRRLLLAYIGPASFDPMVMIEPVVVLLLGSYWFYHHIWLRDTIFEDTATFKLVRYFVLVDLLEVANPLQHSLSVGMSGLIFYVVPLFWMILSRLHFSYAVIRKLIPTVFILGVVLGLYGLKQTYFGFFPFEKTWIHDSGIVALYVGKRVRAISTPDNPQEYAVYLALCLAISWVYVLRGRIISKLASIIGFGVIAWALFMESGRSSIVLSTFAVAITSVAAAKTARSRIVVGFIATTLIVAAFIAINHMPVASQNALVSHQLNGLAHPLNGKDSSLSGHSGRMFSGILEGIKMPVGHGLGSTTTAAGKFTTTNLGTEIDISNIFVSDGIIGGAIYVILIGRVLYVVIRGVHKDTFIHLTTLGVLIATAGQWLNGGLYSVVPIIWILIGYVDGLHGSQH